MATVVVEEQQAEDDVTSYISTASAATQLGVSYTQVRSYIRSGGLTLYKFPLDRRKYLHIDDVQRLKTHKENAKRRV